MSNPAEHDERQAAADALADAAATFAQLTVRQFKRAAPKAFAIFDKTFVAGLVRIQCEIELDPEGAAVAARVVAISNRDNRRTELG